MNSKKANWAFLITIIAYIVFSYAVAFLFPQVAGSLFWSNFLSEVVILLPILIFLFAAKEKPMAFLGFHKIKLGTVLMIALFTLLSMPLVTLLNVFSMIWVDNEVSLMIETMDVGQMPFWLLYLSLGIIAPVFEETVCRGAYYRSYRKSGSAFMAMILSAIIFALIHLNFNQAAYAFAIGILAVLLVEATGSLWSSIIYHGLINGSQAVIMYVNLSADSEIYSESAALITNNFLIYAIGIYLVLTAVTLPLAWAVLVWMSRYEGRSGVLSALWHGKREKKDRMVTIPYLLAIILCICIMTGFFAWLAGRILIALGISF